MGIRTWIDALKAPGVTLEDNTAGGIVLPSPDVRLSKQEIQTLLSKVGAFTAADMERTQPNLRTSIRFLARNVAQLGLHSFVRTSEGGRERDRSSDAAKLIADPSPAQSEYELIFSVVADLALFDEAWLALIPVREESSPSGTGWILRPLPVTDVTVLDGSEWTGDLRVSVRLDGKKRTLGWDRLIHLQGWNPAYGTSGTPPLDALKMTLMEQIAAQAYRTGVWKNAGQVGAFITRPATAAPWGADARKRFTEGMKEYRQGGRSAGGIAVLEDGMEIKTNRLSAKEEQWLEAAQLSLETIARVYFINPAMLGSTGGVTYANMREFRKSLYGETLGPILEQVEQKLNARLLPMVGVDRTRHYLEFNLKAKLAGDFETEGQILQTAVGGPYMSANEARARQNLPAIDGGDELLRPLNMTETGGDEEDDVVDAVEVPAPKSLESVSRETLREAKSATPRAGERTEDLIRGVITKHAERQRAAVLARIRSKSSADWWDAARWDRELKADLESAALAVVGQIGEQVAADLGWTGVFDVRTAAKFLAAVAESRAGMINSTTRDQIAAALETEDGDPAAVFAKLETSRGEVATATLHATLLAFAAVEAGKQVARRAGGDEGPATGTKTWRVNSGNPRDSHAAMSGQTVSLDENFSNGANWPGDPVLGADGVAGCMCSVEVTIE